jgi:uncharacterized protein (TIGR00255 family)
MIASMTGFARREVREAWGLLAWELRSVNHRYLEVGMRLPEEFRALETEFREAMAASLSRGKVDAALRFEPAAGGGPLRVDAALAAQVIQAARELGALAGDERPPTAMELLRWPGVVTGAAPDHEPLHAAARALLKDTLRDLVDARRREGQRIAAAIGERASAIGALVAAVRERLPEVQRALREKYLARLAELKVEADPARLEQELAFVAQRLDVAEELDRLDSHLKELADTLSRKEPVGRRLDFMMQEFNRESNTLGSKAQDTAMTRAAVDMKVLIEQMREQIQNIE